MRIEIKNLSNQELQFKTLEAAAHEKNATLTLIDYLYEFDRRMLYAELGYSSLWLYVHKELGYSEAQTSERIGAMRITSKIPEVRKSLHENKLTLTSAAKFACFVRKEKISPANAVSLLKQIENKSTRETERFLESVSKNKESTTKITFNADNELLQLIGRMKEMQADPTLDLNDIFKKAVKEYVNKRESIKEERRNASRAPEVHVEAGELSNAGKNSENSRYIPVKVRNFIRARSGDRCEFVSAITKIRCESRSQLEYDHIKPYSFGGRSESENIRHLCRKHNQYAAFLKIGEKKMNQFRSA